MVRRSSHSVESGKRHSSGSTSPRNKTMVLSIAIACGIIVAGIVFAVLWPSLRGGSELDRLTAFKKQGEMTFYGADRRPRRTVDIEIADNDTQRQVGMMYRREFTDEQAMLFVFPDQEVRTFWMQHTKLSLDMLFVDSSGIIVTVHRNTKPEDQTRYVSTAPAKFVIEVKAGFTDTYGVVEGDSISWTRQ